jgi:anaerobic selenocysteine-containing dehydrogenase/Fe-S-cluster-containing hydrogenase component 2
MCNQCEVPPCIEACDDKKAIVKTPEGVVIINHSLCPSDIRCEKCYEMCPYDAIDLHADTGKPEKCDFCYDRLQSGEQPVCAQSCMGKAITFGDINDRKSEISKIIKRRQIKAVYPEHGAYPLVFYLSGENMSKHIPIKNYEIPKGRSVPKFPVTQLSSRMGDESSKQYVYTVDNMCPSECGIKVLVKDGIAQKIYGNPHSLINNGTLCAKGATGLQLTYSPHRVKTPLMRTGDRGEDKWKPVTWDYAADYIATKLIQIKNTYGEETVFFDGGDMTDGVAYERLFRAFGTPNILHHGSVCDPNRQWGHKLITGDSRPLPDVQRPMLIRNKDGDLYLNDSHDAKLILHMGVNPFVATRFNYMSYGIPGARADNNCKYIVIDPSHTNSSAIADMWLPIVPGTDASLLAAMLLYILENCSYDFPSQCYIDEEFIDNFTVGWEEFKEAFLTQSRKRDPSNHLLYFSLNWAEEKTGISSKDIKKISHLFGMTKPASIEVGMHGTAHHTNGDVTSILATVLCLITGNADRPGGLVMMTPHKPKKDLSTSGNEFLSRSVTRKVNGIEKKASLTYLQKDRYGDFPSAMKSVLIDLPAKIRNGIKLSYGPFKGHAYPVKAFITRAGNPIITSGNTNDWIKALLAKNNNDEYNVALNVYIDTHISVTGRYADIILPEAGFLERMGLSSVYTISPEIALKDKVIKPLYESRTPYEIMTCLSEAFIKNGDPDIKAEDFAHKYGSETGFINTQLIDTPGFYNIGTPLPYPELPEGCRIIGTPDNPRALLGDRIIKEGELLTVDWLRKNNGVAVWPASYYRYKKGDGSPSELCPNTASGKFEFRFSYLEKINKTLGTTFPTTFYWTDCKWNPKNILYKQNSREYPFQLISGRVHHSMTMTAVCSFLAETDTECMEPLNDDFHYDTPGFNGIPNKSGLPDGKNILFKKGSVSIPVFAINHLDGIKLRVHTGDVVILENPLKNRIKGKVYLTEEVMPGVIKTAFGPGGQRASGLGLINNTSDYTPNINTLFDPNNINSCTGTPGFGDILVKVIKNS